ncbi:HigA family addiction module antitoxin [Sinomonas terrae]|jgi:addiction module HigA family antidote|uniref:HigA family addiction module antitoxin n=1 Tax=Sinomonas terrae TaxID=2908838 RepID=A0ABS9TVX0_9MICC|nr:HigA family addiction module antitoxin [Sinomonas terrae]MCH6468569.1 HigA family addiction module antitoxin [Sinomonas terrae]
MSDSSTITDDLSTPGEILLEEFLEPFGVSQYELAKRIGVDQSRISRIIRGKQAITADTALRLSVFFGTSPQFWLRLQEGYDLAHARVDTPLSAIQPLSA